MIIKVIHKYVLADMREQAVDMPIGAEILTMQLQCGIPHIWALVNRDEKKFEKRLINIVMTGEDILYPNPMNRKYLGTFMKYNDKIVAHVFETIIKE